MPDNGDEKPEAPRESTMQELNNRMKLLLNLATARHPRMQFDLNTTDVVALVAQLQLALAHPQNVGSMSVSAKRTLAFLLAHLNQVQVGLGPLLSLGNQPNFKWGLVQPAPEDTDADSTGETKTLPPEKGVGEDPGGGPGEGPQQVPRVWTP